MAMLDIFVIAKVLMIVEGFENANANVKKLTSCFHMAEKQLDSEANVQCDVGLGDVRAVVKWMSVIHFTAAKEWLLGVSNDEVCNKDDVILCKTLQEYCLPHLTKDGYLIIFNILLNLFPSCCDISLLMIQRGLKSWIELSLEQHWLCANDCLMEKCLQLHGTMKVH
jgi:hypothetical protein